MATTFTSGKKISIGPLRYQNLSLSITAGDTTATIVAPSISSVYHVIATSGLTYTAAPTFSDNTITLAFSAIPIGGYFGTMMVLGK